jgi:hypothetical protein
MVRVSAYRLIVQVLGIGLEWRQVIRDEDLAFAEVGAAKKAAMKRYRAAEDLYKRGEFFGISEEIQST